MKSGGTKPVARKFNVDSTWTRPRGFEALSRRSINRPIVLRIPSKTSNIRSVNLQASRINNIFITSTGTIFSKSPE